MNNLQSYKEEIELLSLLHGDEALSVLNALVERDPILGLLFKRS